MTVHSTSPLRIDFAGGWSDVADFADREGGTVVNAAISILVHVDLFVGGGRIRLHAEDVGEHVTLESSGSMVYDGKLDLHKAALNMLPVTGGIEILSRSEALPGSGLGGSGALDVALLAGLAHLREESYDQKELAELGFLLEAGELGLFGGRQDQYAAALGGFLELEFHDGRVGVRRLSVSESAAHELSSHAVLVYTGQTHFSSQTHARVWAAYNSGDDSVIDAIRSIRDAAREAGDAIEAGDWKRLASLVDENWRNQKRLDPTMVTPATTRIDAAVREAGAWGLKATGAGAGGCVVVLCPTERRSAVTEAARVNGGKVLDFDFTFDGVRAWQQDDAAEES
jgi:D-glycero-alpha-D-manno-heptose-7-phosphate kinase